MGFGFDSLSPYFVANLWIIWFGLYSFYGGGGPSTPSSIYIDSASLRCCYWVYLVLIGAECLISGVVVLVEVAVVVVFDAVVLL